MLPCRDGTARGGEKPGFGCDYKRTEGILNFKHGETSKQVAIDVNKEAKVQSCFMRTKCFMYLKQICFFLHCAGWKSVF